MKKIVFVFWMLIGNIALFMYLLTTGGVREIEPTQFSWILTVLGIASFGLITDMAAFGTVILLSFALYKSKMSDNLSFFFASLVLMFTGSFALKLYVGSKILGIKTDIQPLTFVLVAIIATIYHFFLLSKLEERKTLGVILVGGNQEQWNKLMKLSSDGGMARTASEFPKFNGSYKSKRYFLLDLTPKEVNEVMRNISGNDISVTYLYSETMPVFDQKSMAKWPRLFDLVMYYQEYVDNLM